MPAGLTLNSWSRCERPLTVLPSLSPSFRPLLQGSYRLGVCERERSGKEGRDGEKESRVIEERREEYFFSYVVSRF